MFKNLTVVELAAVLAGPAVGLFFAELGARVIKIENKRTGGDMTRHWKNPLEDPDASISAYYSSVNWNKETLMLDLKSPEAQQQVHALIANADIVISNFKAGSAEKMRMDYKTLKSINPRIIYGYISGFGSRSNRPAFDVVLQAESGYMHMNGTPESGPVKMPIALIDSLTAHQLKQGLLIALMEREKTGKGAFVHASLFDTAIASLANQASNYLMSGHVPERMGSLHPNIAPYGETFATADDKYIVLAIGTNQQFVELCDILNLQQLPEDVRFEENDARVVHREPLRQLLAERIVLHMRAVLMEQLIKRKVPAGAIRSLDAVFELDAAKALVLESSLESQQTKRVKTVAFQIHPAE